jgi:hypothetical protein
MSFTKEDNLLLIKVFKEKFDLNCSLQCYNKNKNQFIIYIKLDSMEKFKSIIIPYLHDSMKYKLLGK